VAQIHYIGKNGVPPAPSELELKKIELAETQNALSRTKLERLRGELVPRREVEFVTTSAVIVLSRQLLSLPSRLVSELRPHLASENLFTVQRCADQCVRGWLEETTALLLKAPAAAEAIVEMEERESGGADPEAKAKRSEAEARKRDAANARRREKRKAKAT
jgi:hypothetical protein